MSKPLPAHQFVYIIDRAKVAKGYDITFRVGSIGVLLQVVAAAQVDDYPPLPPTSVRVIVAAARGPK